LTKDPTPRSAERAAFEAYGSVTLFGYDPKPAVVLLQPRSAGWRWRRTLRAVGAGLLVAPLVGMVPPHAPWILGALGGSAFVARRRWQEAFTLVRLEARCPRCDTPFDVKPSRLRDHHPLTCEHCHYESSLVIPEDVLRPYLGSGD